MAMGPYSRLLSGIRALLVGFWAPGRLPVRPKGTLFTQGLRNSQDMGIDGFQIKGSW